MEKHIIYNSDGSMQLGEVVIDNIKYIFNENGELISQEDIAPPTEDIAPPTEDIAPSTEDLTWKNTI